MTAQSAAALQKAMAVRAVRAPALRAVARASRRDGRELVAELLLDPPPELLTLTAEKLLLRVKGVGARNADLLLRRAGASVDRTVGDLSPRQRDLLADLLLNTR